MDTVQCTLVQAITELQNPGDFLIVRPQPSLDPYAKQIWVVLPGGHIQHIPIEQGVSGNRGWNGDKVNPILYAEIVTKAWRGWMQWIGGVSWLVANP